ncbi:MAG: tetratricopeptide repeat protein [Candidatus Cloacimonetes bacterium]|nr:tetratricopeptide repeat protein [Candidatus Cloacimonadota bacterium]
MKQSDSSQQDLPFQLQVKTDSRKEFRELLLKEMDKWIITPQPLFGNRMPLEMADSATGKKEIENLFLKFKIPDFIPMKYLADRLHLDSLKIPELIPDYENTAAEYLDKIIAQDWAGMLHYKLNQNHYAREIYLNNFLNRIKNNRILRKMREHNLIASAVTDDHRQALVFHEINGKYDLTVTLYRKNSQWFVKGFIMGPLELVNGENEAIQQIAVLLSKNDFSRAFSLLRKYTDIYFDSADMYYYWGMYYSLTHNPAAAEIYFLTAIEIDPDFIEAKYNYAYILHTRGDKPGARDFYREIIEQNPQYLKALNNLASLYIEEGNFTEAADLLELCLGIDPDFKFARENRNRLQKLIEEEK